MSRRAHLFMIRPNLGVIAAPALPEGFSLRAYRPGDEAAWVEIIRRGYGGPFDRASAASAFVEATADKSEGEEESASEEEQGRRAFGSEAQAPQQSQRLHATGQARREYDRTGGDWPEDAFERHVLADASFRPERLFFIERDGSPFGSVPALRSSAAPAFADSSPPAEAAQLRRAGATAGKPAGGEESAGEEEQGRTEHGRMSGPCVATAGAFQSLLHGDRTGYVHMMAVLPEFRRRGLGGALLGRCLLYFREQGWRDAVLDTDATRLPAIRLYLGNGFEPFPEVGADVEKWRTVLAALGMPGLSATLKLRTRVR